MWRQLAAIRYPCGLLLVVGLSLVTPGCPQRESEPVDVGYPEDAGGPDGGGESRDAGTRPDAGGAADAGARSDAGVLLDGGEAVDGGGLERCRVPWASDLQRGTALADEALSLAVDDEGNLFLAGYEGGVLGETNVEPSGDSRAVVASFRPDGTLGWTRTLDTPGTDTVETVRWDAASGTLHLAGRTDGAFAGFGNQGQFDLFTATLDSSAGGKVLRFLQAGTERPQHPRRMSLDAQGALVVGGYDDVHVVDSAVVAWEDAFIARFTPHEDGTFTPGSWLQANTREPDLFLGVAAPRAPGSEIYVSGTASGGPNPGMFVLRLEADGSVGWRRQLSSVSVDSANAVALSPSGELYVTGATFLQLGKERFGQQDVFLAKLDRTTGQPLWISQMGTADSDWPTDIGFDSSGHVYIAGYTLGSFLAAGNQGQGDLFVLKFEPSGAPEGVWQRGTDAQDEPAALAVDHCDRVFVAGYTEGELVPGRAVGGRDMFLLQVDVWRKPERVGTPLPLPRATGP